MIFFFFFFKIGERTGELVLKDSNMGLAVPLSSTLQECQQVTRWENGPGVDLVNFFPVS